MASVTPEERFDALVDDYAGRTAVTLPGESGTRGFGSSALKVNGSIFAMLTRGRLVVKLPAGRVSTLIEEGTGQHFDAGKGRPMKEWLTVTNEDGRVWRHLTAEAFEFVASLRR